jgi:hypothetical protein
MSECKECGQELPEITSVWTELRVRVDLKTGRIIDWLGVEDMDGVPAPIGLNTEGGLFVHSERPVTKFMREDEEGGESSNATNI